MSLEIQSNYAVTGKLLKSVYGGDFVVVQSFSHVRFFVTPWTEALQASCPSLSPGGCSNSCLLSR